MSILTSPELFINVKRIPDKSSREYHPFFKEEVRKIREGVTINSVKIPAWVYWHINHWKINIDIKDPVTGYIDRPLCTPWLRDNEWLIGEHIEKAEKSHSGLLIVGTRQFGKSEFGASYEGRSGIIFKNSQNVIAGLSTNDLNLLLSKLDKGLNNVHPYFKPIRIKDDWKTQVTLGYKTPQGDRKVWSEYLIRNLDGGKNTENLAGPTTTSILIDEIGKGDFLEAFIAAEPALKTPYGWRGSPIFIGTSGSFDKSQDLQAFREDLDAYNFIEVETKDEKERDIYFIPGFKSNQATRKKIRLSTYLKVKKGSELDTIPIHIVANPTEEVEKIKEEIKKLEDAGKPVLAKKKKMYYPIVEEDLFLTNEGDDVFADVKDICRSHLAYLESIELNEEYGWMIRDENGKPKFVKAKNGEKPIQSFPTAENEEKDAPIIIWDHPLPGQEFGVLHVAGSDPYNQDESYYSPSLGTLYIYRRTYDPLKGRFQETFVASYSARPKNISKWRDQVRLLLEYYAATVLPENEEPGFIRWFDDKFLSHWVEDGIDLAKEINPNTKVNRRKGLSASIPNIRYGNGLLKAHILEELIMGQDEKTGENIVKLGVIRIRDKMLLKEIIEHTPAMARIRRSASGEEIRSSKRKKKTANVDRVVAARHALILAKMKDKYFPIAKVSPPKETEKVEPEHKTPRSPFLTKASSSPFGKMRKTPFGGKL